MRERERGVARSFLFLFWGYGEDQRVTFESMAARFAFLFLHSLFEAGTKAVHMCWARGNRRRGRDGSHTGFEDSAEQSIGKDILQQVGARMDYLV